jgi:hypothetical protein
MNALMTKKSFAVYQPAAIVNNASLTCNVIDTTGYADLEIIVMLGATDIALTALKVQESDTKSSATALTSGVDITASVFGTANQDTNVASVLPSATDDNKLFSFKIDLRGRKTFLLPVVTVGNGSTGAYLSIVALLGRAQDAPRLASEAGYSQRIVI